MLTLQLKDLETEVTTKGPEQRTVDRWLMTNDNRRESLVFRFVGNEGIERRGYTDAGELVIIYPGLIVETFQRNVSTDCCYCFRDWQVTMCLFT